MDTDNVESLIESLDENINDLKETLAPLLGVSLSEKASKLPLLDKAQLFILWTYAIESLLFCEFGGCTFICNAND